MIGLALGAVASVAVWIALGSVELAPGVGISLVTAGSVACTIGLLLPWSLAAVGIDPAFGSGPVATIIQDVLTIGLYFVAMSLLTG
jgi:magnesium transporter